MSAPITRPVVRLQDSRQQYVDFGHDQALLSFWDVRCDKADKNE